MPHVEDTLLVAYADDALDAAGRAVVETHLVSCPECRARVEDERALAARAAEVLGRGTPDFEMAVPPFAEIARRGERLHATPGGGASGAGQRRRRLPPLAWAAMLVVGLGAAWIARTLLVSPEFNAPGDAIRAERLESTAAEAAPAEPPATGAAGAAASADEAALDARKTQVAQDAAVADGERAAAPAAVDPTVDRAVAVVPQTVEAPPPPVAEPTAEARAQRYAAGAARPDSARDTGDTARMALRAAAPAAAPAPPAPVRAEAGVEGGVITGIIRDAVTNQPLAGGQVVLEGTGVGVVTNAQGAFVLRDVPAGAQTLRVALIGYSAGSQELTVAAEQVTTAEIALAPSTIALDAITITGAAAPAAAVLDPEDAAWRGASAGEAAARGAAVRGIADAPVELVWLGRAAAPWRARVLQRVDDVAIEIVEWRTAPAPAGMSGTLEDGRGFLFVARDGASVLLRGAFTPERLRELAARLTPLP